MGLDREKGIELFENGLGSLTVKDGVSIAKHDVTGKELVPELVRKTRAEEMACFEECNVYRVVPRSHQKSTGGRAIGTRWVDINKGDAQTPNCRSRLVGRKLKVAKDDTLYEAIPPFEVLRSVLMLPRLAIPIIQEIVDVS